ncbi:PIN domain-containing protein [Candidatus Bathyarchaeota archaeon]|nr:PIN domain-containing protein [Candidatus Bathyarchaeota archaeon]
MSDSGIVLDTSILIQRVVKEKYTELALRLIKELESVYTPQLILHERRYRLSMLVDLVSDNV